MINSKEIFVECNLRNSQQTDSNSFTTAIGGGIVLEAGDTIEIDNVAINDKGIGGNMIEIPKENSGNNLATNKVSLVVGKYITTGSRFCMPMPFAGYKIINDNGSSKYGYAKEMVIGTGTGYTDYRQQGELPFITADMVASFKTFKGSHHYQKDPYRFLKGLGQSEATPNCELGVKLHSIVAPITAETKTGKIPNNRQTLLPYDMTNGDGITYLYDFEKDLCNIEVNKGYETAENIARHITDQFHEGIVNSDSNTTEIKIVEGNNLYVDGRNNTSITNAFTKIKCANGIDNRVGTGVKLLPDPTDNAFPIGYGNKNSIYETLYYKKPYRHIFGERLNWLSADVSKKEGRYDKIKPEENEPIANKKVWALIRMLGNGNERGDVIITNLYSQNLFYDGTYAGTGTGAFCNLKLWIDFCRNTEEYMLNKNIGDEFQKDTENWAVWIDYGRYNDEESKSLIYGTSTPSSSAGGSADVRALNPSFQVNNDVGLGTVSAVSPYRAGYYSRFVADIYDNKVLTADMITQGYYFVETLYPNDGGLPINVREFCVENNICLCVLGNLTDAQLQTGAKHLLGFFTNAYADAVYDKEAIVLKNPDNPHILFKDVASDFAVYNGGYWGYDPSFCRNTTAMAINTSKSPAIVGGNTNGLNQPQQYINFIQTGSPNANCVFDEELQHFTLANLHFPYMDANGLAMIKLMMSADIIENVGSAELGKWIIPFPDKISATTDITSAMWWGYGGSTLLDIKGYTNADLGFNEPIDIDENNYKYTFFHRIGFDYTDLFGGLGSPSALYNPATKDFQKFPYQQARPITTNAKIITTYSEALGLNYVSSVVGNILNQKQHYDMNVSCNVPQETNCESAEIMATRVPTRLNNPYWLVQSNIIPSSNYINTDGKLKNVLSVVNRAYTSNDFAYGMSVATQKKIENPQTLTEITTSIFNNDFSVPKLDENTVVIYKITKNYQTENRILQMNIKKMEAKGK